MTHGQRQLLTDGRKASFRTQHGLTRTIFDKHLHRAQEAQARLIIEERNGPEAFYLLDRFGDINVNHHRIQHTTVRPR